MPVTKDALDALCQEAGNIIDLNDGKCPAVEQFAVRVIDLCVSLLGTVEQHQNENWQTCGTCDGAAYGKGVGFEICKTCRGEGRVRTMQ